VSESPEGQPLPRNRFTPPDAEAAAKQALSDLDRRVQDALSQEDAKARAEEALAAKAEAARASGAAWRIIIDLVAATVLLGGLGYALDVVLRWSPVGLLTGLFAGFALGMWMAARRAIALQKRGSSKQA
jgi:F0F1-type ATP synthase assembly protein I